MTEGTVGAENEVGIEARGDGEEVEGEVGPDYVPKTREEEGAGGEGAVEELVG